MPIIKSAIKRAKQTIKRRERNLVIKREIKDTTKGFIASPSATTLSAAHSELDTAVKKGLIKKNTAARRKANLSRIAKANGVKLVAKAAPVAEKKAPAVKATAKTVAKTAEKKVAKPAPRAAAKKAAK